MIETDAIANTIGALNYNLWACKIKHVKECAFALIIIAVVRLRESGIMVTDSVGFLSQLEHEPLLYLKLALDVGNFHIGTDELLLQFSDLQTQLLNLLLLLCFNRFLLKL